MEIKFRAKNRSSYEIREHPVPASTMIPDWWKDMPPIGGDGSLRPAPFTPFTAKKCFPLLDGITAGYIVTLWADIYVEQTDDVTNIKWIVSEPVLESWPWDQSSTYEIPEGYSRTVFKYTHGWAIETPKGTSCLITHPIGYPNLPFRTLTGVIDTDALKSWANSPFVIKKGFEGIIEKGTPMFQVIPYRRDNWKAKVDYLPDGEEYIRNEKLHTRIVSSYGRYLRSKKKYE